MEKKSYKLVGSINPLGEIPELVFPVFGRDRKLYLQVCDLTTIIDGFAPITEVNQMAMIRPLSETNAVFGEVEESYSVGSDQLIGYQTDSDTIFFGNMKSFNEYLKTHPVTTDILSDQVESLRHDDRLSVQYRKKFQTPKKES